MREPNPDHDNAMEWKCKKGHFCKVPSPLFWFKAEFVDEEETDLDARYVTVWVSDSAAQLIMGKTGSWYVDPQNRTAIIDTERNIAKASNSYRASEPLQCRQQDCHHSCAGSNVSIFTI